MSEAPQSLPSSILKYASSTMYRQLLGIINALIKPLFLTPALYGLWHLLNLIPQYAASAHLGARSAMRYQIPFFQASGETDRIKPIEATVYRGTLGINLIIGAAVIAFALLGEFSGPVRLGLITMGLLVPLSAYRIFYIGLLRAHQEFGLITRANYLKATVAVLLGATLLYHFGIEGLFLSTLLTSLAVVLFLRRQRPLGIEGGFSASLYLGLVRQGFPILCLTLADVLIRTSDRLIVSHFLDNEQLGFYGIAIGASTFAMQLPGASREVIEPRLMQSMGAEDSPNELTQHLSTPLLFSTFLMPWICAGMAFGLPLLVPLLLPPYAPGIVPAQILLVGCYYLSLAYLLRGVIIAHHWQFAGAGLMLLGLAANIGLSIALIKAGWGMHGVALGTSLSFILLFALLYGLILLHARQLAYAWGRDALILSMTLPLGAAIALPAYYGPRMIESGPLLAVASLGLFTLVWSICWMLGRRLHPVLGEKSLRQWLRGARGARATLRDQESDRP